MVGRTIHRSAWWTLAANTTSACIPSIIPNRANHARPERRSTVGITGDIAEVYYFASGAGTWRVGGELENPAEDDINGRSVKEVRGPGVIGVLKGYTDQKVAAGDILIVPPGVPHSPGLMTEPTKIIRVVIDPHRVMPLFPATTQVSSQTRPQTTAAAKVAPKLPGTFTFIPKADIDRVLKEEETPGPSGDRPVRTIDLANINWRLGVYVLHSPELPKTPEARPPAAGITRTSLKSITSCTARERL